VTSPNEQKFTGLAAAILIGGPFVVMLWCFAIYLCAMTYHNIRHTLCSCREKPVVAQPILSAAPPSASSVTRELLNNHLEKLGEYEAEIKAKNAYE
jgi:hypothetical protein